MEHEVSPPWANVCAQMHHSNWQRQKIWISLALIGGLFDASFSCNGLMLVSSDANKGPAQKQHRSEEANYESRLMICLPVIMAARHYPSKCCICFCMHAALAFTKCAWEWKCTRPWHRILSTLEAFSCMMHDEISACAFAGVTVVFSCLAAC